MKYRKLEKHVMDGNTAAAHISYMFTEIAAIYPITPSSTMAELVDEWAGKGRKNLFGKKVEVYEMQSEAGAAGAVHGALKAGALTTTYTASQGLLLMIPNMYKIAGELLPTVFHVAARAIATNALSIFGDHSDVMAARQTGFAMLCESSVQEVMDLSAVAHLASLKSSVPFMNFFDGFRTSHELNKIEVLENQDIEPLLDKKTIENFKKRGLNPSAPAVSGTNQNPETYFQQRETVNKFYLEVPKIVQEYMKKVNDIRGTNYDIVEYYGDKDATDVVIAMGSISTVLKSTVKYLNENGRKTGVVQIRLYRPFPEEQLIKCLPKTVKNIAVLDRTKEPGSQGEPLLLDVQSAIMSNGLNINVIGGRYGIGSKDVLPSHLISVFDELKKPHSDQKKRFTIGIDDDVTFSSLAPAAPVDLVPKDTFQAKFWGFGSDGTVGANKQAIKIIGENTDRYCQAYFSYDSKKSGGLTVSHLRFGKDSNHQPYLITEPDFVSCSFQSYARKLPLVNGLKKNGTFLLNTNWDLDQLNKNLPGEMKKYLKDNNINFYCIDAVKIARDSGLGNRTNTVLQTVFFHLAKIIPFESAVKKLKESAEKAYSKKSKEIVDANFKAIDSAVENLKKISLDDLTTENFIETKKFNDDYIDSILTPIQTQKGNDLKVGDFVKAGILTGEIPTNTSKYEKREISPVVPVWDSEKCIQCNECSLVCPHACIRPFLLDENEAEKAPIGFETVQLKGSKELKYRIQTSYADCTGCGLCIEKCPSKPEKALSFADYKDVKEKNNLWDFAVGLKKKDNPLKIDTVKGSQFERPLFEFSGACSGCGETPYIKLLTQLFGEKMVISNATGCSSIYGGAFDSSPWVKNSDGTGPTWSNSLFEDNAEYGLGMKLAFDAKGEADKSIWIIGGDGWAYDIGYGGLDHILASGKNVNVFVMDNEVYANTGGQSSKATPAAAIAKFASSGKKTAKKDLAQMAMSYKNVYVATVSSGANSTQTLKAFVEAEKYNGPSLIIGYTPCISHGLKGGMVNGLNEASEAVQSGYWPLLRYNPDLSEDGKNPLRLDYKNPDFSKMKAFLLKQTRFSALKNIDSKIADKLYEKTISDAQKRFSYYKEIEENFNKKTYGEFFENAPNYTINEAQAEASRCLNCPTKPCQEGCPAGIDIPAFIKKIEEGKLKDAHDILLEYSTLSSICGRVCPQEKQCKSQCVRGIEGIPISIGMLEKFVADYALRNDLVPTDTAPSTGKKIAVIGSGPAGLAAAETSANKGHSVTVYEKENVVGGILRLGVPNHRLPLFILERKISILKNKGVIFETGIDVCKDISISDLQKKYDSVFFGIGANYPKKLNIKGEEFAGVYSSNEFLKDVNMETNLIQLTNKNVLVVGGGNTAMDVAASAVRKGAKNVSIVYRRDMDNLPARKDEIDEVIDDGVNFKLLNSPVEIVGENNTVKGLKVRKNELGEPDSSGRKRPVEIPSSDYIIDCDVVINAIGTDAVKIDDVQKSNIKTNEWNCFEVDNTYKTSIDGIYAGGDLVTGPKTVVSAMISGVRAAKAIDKYLKN